MSGKVASESPASSVFITHYDDDEARKVADILRALHETSDGRHGLVDDPDVADLIFVGGIGNETSMDDYIRKTLRNRHIDRHPEKCFTLCYRDHPVVFNRGIYESGVRNIWSRPRCYGGVYAMSGHLNAEVERNSGVEKDLLFSFIGRMSHRSRRTLLGMQFVRQDHVLEDTTYFNYWTAAAAVRQEREAHYASVLNRSKFCICPRGVGTGSIRTFEAMRAGVAPVIISDGWTPPANIPWDKFSIFVKESDLARLEAILSEREDDHAALGAAAKRCWEQHFSPQHHFNYLVSACTKMKQEQRIPEAVYWNLRHVFAAGRVLAGSAKRGVQALRRG